MTPAPATAFTGICRETSTMTGPAAQHQHPGNRQASPEADRGAFNRDLANHGRNTVRLRLTG